MHALEVQPHAAAEVAERLGVAVLWLRGDGGLVAATPAASGILGYPSGESLAAAGDDPARIWENPAEVATWIAAPGGFSVRRFAARREDGAAVVVALSHGAAQDIGGPAPLFAALAWSDEDAIARESRRTQLARSQSIASASGAIGHKLNNLLAGLLGYLTLLRRTITEKGVTDATHRYLDALDETGKRFHELTNQLMIIAQKNVSHPTQEVDVATIVSAVVERIGATIPVEFSPLPVLPSLPVDAKLLDEAFEQTILGVAQILPAVNRIAVSACTTTIVPERAAMLGVEPGGFVAISVEHEHEPAPENSRERLFDPYFTAQGRGKGAELLLTRAWGIIALHRGTIDVVPLATTGTRLDIYLPTDRR